jgi:hypothetical protein
VFLLSKDDLVFLELLPPATVAEAGVRLAAPCNGGLGLANMAKADLNKED